MPGRYNGPCRIVTHGDEAKCQNLIPKARTLLGIWDNVVAKNGGTFKGYRQRYIEPDGSIIDGARVGNMYQIIISTISGACLPYLPPGIYVLIDNVTNGYIEPNTQHIVKYNQNEDNFAKILSPGFSYRILPDGRPNLLGNVLSVIRENLQNSLVLDNKTLQGSNIVYPSWYGDISDTGFVSKCLGSIKGIIYNIYNQYFPGTVVIYPDSLDVCDVSAKLPIIDKISAGYINDVRMKNTVVYSSTNESMVSTFIEEMPSVSPFEGINYKTIACKIKVTFIKLLLKLCAKTGEYIGYEDFDVISLDDHKKIETILDLDLTMNIPDPTIYNLNDGYQAWYVSAYSLSVTHSHSSAEFRSGSYAYFAQTGNCSTPSFSSGYEFMSFIKEILYSQFMSPRIYYPTGSPGQITYDSLAPPEEDDENLYYGNLYIMRFYPYRLECTINIDEMFIDNPPIGPVITVDESIKSTEVKWMRDCGCIHPRAYRGYYDVAITTNKPLYYSDYTYNWSNYIHIDTSIPGDTGDVPYVNNTTIHDSNLLEDFGELGSFTIIPKDVKYNATHKLTYKTKHGFVGGGFDMVYDLDITTTQNSFGGAYTANVGGIDGVTTLNPSTKTVEHIFEYWDENLGIQTINLISLSVCEHYKEIHAIEYLYSIPVEGAEDDLTYPAEERTLIGDAKEDLTLYVINSYDLNAGIVVYTKHTMHVDIHSNDVTHKAQFDPPGLPEPVHTSTENITYTIGLYYNVKGVETLIEEKVIANRTLNNALGTSGLFNNDHNKDAFNSTGSWPMFSHHVFETTVEPVGAAVLRLDSLEDIFIDGCHAGDYAKAANKRGTDVLISKYYVKAPLLTTSISGTGSWPYSAVGDYSHTIGEFLKGHFYSNWPWDGYNQVDGIIEKSEMIAGFGRETETKGNSVSLPQPENIIISSWKEIDDNGTSHDMFFIKLNYGFRNIDAFINSGLDVVAEKVFNINLKQDIQYKYIRNVIGENDVIKDLPITVDPVINEALKTGDYLLIDR